MGITRVGAAGNRGAELCVGTDGEGSRAAVLPLRAGTRPCAGPVTRLETFPGVPEV